MGVCSISLKAGLVADAAPRPRQTGTNRIGPVKSQANMVEVVNSLAGMVVGTNAGVEGHRRGRNPPVQLHRALLFVLALAGFSGDSGGSVIPYNLDWSAEREGLRGDGLHEMSRNHGLRRTSSILIDGTCQGPAVAGSYRPFSTGALRDTALSAQRESCCHIRGGGDCLPFLRWEVTTENLNAQLLKAAAHGKTKKVVELIERGAAVNCMDASKQTPLLKAAEHGHCDTVELLVARGAVIGMGDERASQAMHYAAYNGHTHVVEVLARLGAAVNDKNKFGYSPLQYASADGRLHTVRRLVELGADVRCCDNMQWTALHRAAGNGHGRVIRALVEHGADVNASDLQNYSALHEATWCGHADVVRVLVRLGADVKMVDAWGNTPLDLAMGQMQEDEGLIYRVLLGQDQDEEESDLDEEPPSDAPPPKKHRWCKWICCLANV